METYQKEVALNFHCLELEFKSVIFWRREEKLEYLEKKPLENNNNKLNPHMTSSSGIEPRLHWWEAIAVTSPSNNNWLIFHMC